MDGAAAAACEFVATEAATGCELACATAGCAGTSREARTDPATRAGLPNGCSSGAGVFASATAADGEREPSHHEGVPMPAAITGMSVRMRLAIMIASSVALMVVVISYTMGAVADLVTAQKRMTAAASVYMAGLSSAALAAQSAANDERGFLLTGDRKFVDEALSPHEKEIEEKDAIPRSLISGGIRRT